MRLFEVNPLLYCINNDLIGLHVWFPIKYMIKKISVFWCMCPNESILDHGCYQPSCSPPYLVQKVIGYFLNFICKFKPHICPNECVCVGVDPTSQGSLSANPPSMWNIPTTSYNESVTQTSGFWWIFFLMPRWFDQHINPQSTLFSVNIPLKVE